MRQAGMSASTKRFASAVRFSDCTLTAGAPSGKARMGTFASWPLKAAEPLSCRLGPKKTSGIASEVRASFAQREIAAMRSEFAR